MNYREWFFEELDSDPALAHHFFFPHSNRDAPFHDEMVRAWHSPTKRILTMAFRGCGKSTKAEEAITLEVCYQRVKNVLILGESESRAEERLAAIKHHLEYNEDLQQTFDVGPGDLWQSTKAVTSTGIMIQCAGRGQSLRGVKYLDARPDLIFLDDVEDKESGSVATEEARAKTKSWLAGTVIPSLVPWGRMRMAATPLHPKALAPTLARAEDSWTTKTYPIAYQDDDGHWASAWPDRFSAETLFDMKKSYEEIGESETWQQEYMCQAVDPGSQTFKPEDFQIAGITPGVPAVARSWHGVYAIYDPARTTNTRSATTGKAVASWVGNRLIVWEATARKWMPDEIVADLFATCGKYSPVAVGVEENGLNEWLLQPIRTAQMARGTIIPLRALRAPKGKYDFIRGLQPYFTSKSVVFADHMPDLQQQLLGFPTGHIDAPNALAYMLHMKLGMPIYDNFTEGNISPEAIGKRETPSYLLVNSNNQVTTAILAQHQSGRLIILWDAIADGDAGTVLTDLLQSALIYMRSQHPALKPREAEPDFPGKLRLVASPRHFDDYTIYGLRAAVRKAGYELERGAETGKGREEIRALLRRVSHGGPALCVGPEASWALRAFAGGYARDATSTLAIDNAYAVLMEPLEAFAGRMRVGDDAIANPPNYQYTPDGRRYVSALVQRV